MSAPQAGARGGPPGGVGPARGGQAGARPGGGGYQTRAMELCPESRCRSKNRAG